MANLTYTPEQQQVIDYRGQNLLVSAGAGSGKTTTMIQHVLSLMNDKNNPTPIKNFLIISFTKASASDMKNKLIKKLSSLNPTPYILEQLDDVLTSDISNLHSYCSRFLKQYFYEANLDPTFTVLDESVTDALKQKALDKLFQEKAEKGDSKFFELIDIFSSHRHDGKLKKSVLKLYDFLCSIVDGEKWIKEKLNSLYDSDLTKNSAANVINSFMKAEKKRLEDKINELILKLSKLGEKKYVAYLQSVESRVKLVNYSRNFEDNSRHLAHIEKFVNIPKLQEGKEEIHAEVLKLKELVRSRLDAMRDYALSTELEDIIPNLETTKKRLFNLYELTKEFKEIYDSLKKEKGGLDFNDLERYTLEVLSHEEIRKEIQRKYRYVFVDEYQDINGVQEEILNRISNNNRFMVGDVKQSIYRFRLCDPEIFLNKYNLYGNGNGGELIKLNANFRSKKQILDFVNQIFVKTMTVDFGGVDYASGAKLVHGDPSQVDDKRRVEIMFADTAGLESKQEKEIELYSVEEDKETSFAAEQGAYAEGLMVANKISKLVKSGKIMDGGKLRKIRYSDITILSLSRSPALARLVQVLEDKKIPVTTDIETSPLEDEYIFGIKSFLDLLANYKVDYSLFSCLYSKLFGFSTNELAEIKEKTDEKRYYNSVRVASGTNVLSQETSKKLENFFEIYNRYQEWSRFLGVKELANRIVDELNVKIKMSFEDNSSKRLQKLDFYIANLEDINLYEYLSEQALADIKCEASTAMGAVKVMTIHKSKGLEFGVVFLVNANRGFNFKSVNESDMIINKDLGVCLDYYDRQLRYRTPTLAKEAIKLIETRKLLEEQQRLLYVALTRATDYLYVVGCGKMKDVLPVMPASPTCFMDFMGSLLVNPEENKNIDYDITIADALKLIDADVENPKRQVLFGQGDISSINKIKEILNRKYPYESSTSVPMKTSVTSILKDNEDNEKLFSNIVYSEGRSSAIKGTKLHKLMEILTFSETKEQINLKAKELFDNGLIDEKFEQDEIELIAAVLKNKEFIDLVKGAKKVYKEKEFYLLLPANKLNENINSNEGVVVQGVVDLCLIYDDGIVIVDYKSGKLTDEKLKKYFNQTELYAEAMEKSFNRKVKQKYILSLGSAKLFHE